MKSHPEVPVLLPESTLSCVLSLLIWIAAQSHPSLECRVSADAQNQTRSPNPHKYPALIHIFTEPMFGNLWGGGLPLINRCSLTQMGRVWKPTSSARPPRKTPRARWAWTTSARPRRPSGTSSGGRTAAVAGWGGDLLPCPGTCWQSRRCPPPRDRWCSLRTEIM